MFKGIEAKAEALFFLGTIAIVGLTVTIVWAGKMIYYGSKVLEQKLQAMPLIQHIESLLELLS